MERGFWEARWAAGEIGFHKGDVNEHLLAHADEWLGDRPAAETRVLVPLCGKTLDLDWLARRGHPVVGIELSARAVEQFFAEQGRTPTRRTRGPFDAWVDGDLELWVGDVFDLAGERFDRAWDRGALVALPPAMRERYVPVVREALRGGRVLLTVLDGQPGGPPHAVPDTEILRHYPGARRLSAAPADDPRWAGHRVVQSTWLADVLL